MRVIPQPMPLLDSESAEQWRAVPGFDAYEVSDRGRLRLARSFKQYPKGHLLKLRPNIDRYHVVGLQAGGRRHDLRVARLVLLAFVGPPPTSAHHAAHRDGSRTNDVLSNLRWATPAENEQDKVVHGTQGRCPGELHHAAKLTAEEVREIRAQRAAGVRNKDVAKRFNISPATVCDLVARRGWRHVE